jgi:hypothetical protein
VRSSHVQSAGAAVEVGCQVVDVIAYSGITTPMVSSRLA